MVAAGANLSLDRGTDVEPEPRSRPRSGKACRPRAGCGEFFPRRRARRARALSRRLSPHRAAMGRGAHRPRHVDRDHRRHRGADAGRRAGRCDAVQAAGDGDRRHHGDVRLVVAAAVSRLPGSCNLARRCAGRRRGVSAGDRRGLARHLRPCRLHPADRPQRDIQSRGQRGRSRARGSLRLLVRPDRRVLPSRRHGDREPRQHPCDPRPRHR